MADQNLPDPNAAPNPAVPQAPGSGPTPAPADDKPVVPSTPTVTLTEDQKTYLKGQGLTDAELASPDAITKIISHAQSSQKALSETKNKLDKVQGVFTPPADPANPFAVPGTTPAAPDQTQPTNPATPPASQGIDAVTAFTLSTQLATSFPLLKDDLTTGKLYQDMQALGIPLQVGGQVNLNGLINFAKREQESRELAAKLAELNKPGEGAIPDANPTTPQQPASDAPMDAKIARAILFQDPNHPRAAEARTFLQGKVGRK